jgi:hypothetical protein
MDLQTTDAVDYNTVESLKKKDVRKSNATWGSLVLEIHA